MGGGPRGGGFEKPKNFKDSWIKLLQYIREYWLAIMVALVGAIIGTILTLIGPDKLSELTDTITAGIMGQIDMDHVAQIGFTLVGYYLIASALTLMQGLIMAQVTQGISKKLRTNISEKINTLPIAYFDKTSTGDILSRVTNDVDTMAQSMNQSVSTMVTSVTLLFGSLFMMLKTNLILTLTAVLSTFVGFGLMLVIMSRSQKYFKAQQKDLGLINGHIEEIYTGHSTVKVYNNERATKAEFDAINNSLRTSGFRAQSLSGLMMPIMQFIGNFGYVAVCVVGAALAIEGRITFGVIVAFIMYVRYFTQPLSQIAQAMQSLQSTAAASERVFEMLNEEDMADESHKTEKLDDIEGKVEFDHVRFSYSDDADAEPVIKDFSAVAQSGQKVAIVGPTGAGKTTMVNLLMRFHEIDGGAIRIDNRSTMDFTRENIHDQFCMVLQDTWIFEGTIRENLVYAEENVSDDTMRQASRAVGLDHFVQTLPKGYDTVLNDQVSLSEGQKQQITIARAMIADRPMLILDEATSSVDTRTEIHIQNAMDELMKGRTSFIIAHRLSTIRNSDLILVMKDGDIVESGKHDELLAADGFYAELYNSQFSEEAA
ncbi:ABC transporter ATP-binding protein [Fundicoccus culcitae]|uniref:ABC transporter ATP-binding protein/permease n=1 Tax=Fundicoccus culcitae TaxID=2969821 RepID=A0ABY5PAC7_9LACT|nr:ABC transporter ATP-binding protein/permease [Fundicoccus culcitae]